MLRLARAAPRQPPQAPVGMAARGSGGAKAPFLRRSRRARTEMKESDYWAEVQTLPLGGLIQTSTDRSAPGDSGRTVQVAPPPEFEVPEQPAPSLSKLKLAVIAMPAPPGAAEQLSCALTVSPFETLA